MTAVIRRYTSSGARDVTFGTNGEVRHEAGIGGRFACGLTGNQLVVAVATQTRIRILVIRPDGSLVSSSEALFSQPISLPLLQP